MSKLKELYRRFKAWQVHPADYPVADVPRYCNNCGYEYTGNFCPVCGQRATAGRITWVVVRRGVMDVWGLGGRSLPYSLWQLMWRPGYFISDYIGGKWQSSFPPVKMLVLVAVLVYFIGKAINPEYWGAIIEPDTASVSSSGWQYYYHNASQWIENHLEWLFLFIFSLLILPTWLVFRHSPRNSRHTLPQGFFAQVFMTTEYLIWLFIITACIKLSGMDVGGAAGSSDGEIVLATLMFIPVIVLVNYKQLFGYGWWGIVWRVLVVVLSVVFCFVAVVILRHLTFTTGFEAEIRQITGLMSLFFILLTCLMLSVTDVVNRRLWRERGWWRAMVLPSLFFVLLIGVGIGMERLHSGILLSMLSDY